MLRLWRDGRGYCAQCEPAAAAGGGSCMTTVGTTPDELSHLCAPPTEPHFPMFFLRVYLQLIFTRRRLLLNIIFCNSYSFRMCHCHFLSINLLYVIKCAISSPTHMRFWHWPVGITSVSLSPAGRQSRPLDSVSYGTTESRRDFTGPWPLKGSMMNEK